MENYSGADIAATCGAATLAAIHDHLVKYPDPEEARKHREELEITYEHFKEAYDKVKTSSYQSATIHWNPEKESSSGII